MVKYSLLNGEIQSQTADTCLVTSFAQDEMEMVYV